MTPTRVIRWTEGATSELAAIAEYISVSSPVYAEQTVERLVRRVEQAREFPESGRLVPEIGRHDIREFVESPYRVMYLVRADAVVVLAVIHGRRDVRPVGSGP